jgi:RimJ/RimL family protein N-acetyltransferase
MKDSVPKYLYTKRLVLELFDHGVPEHYECLLGSMNNPTAHARMGDFGIRTPAEFDALNAATRLTGAHCRGMVADLDIYYILRIGDRNGPMIGGVSVAQRGASVPPDIGWCILEAYMGKGYATEAAREFLRYLREDLGLQEIMVWPGATNRESCRVAEKLGFVKGGSVRSAEEPGKTDVAYVLPGMKFKDLTLSMWGDEGSNQHVPL